MKKIFALLLIATLTFSSSFATMWLETTISKDDLLQSEMFYIDGQWYIKRDNKLVKIEWIKFYSIAWQRYIKKDWKIEKVSENKIYKVNWKNYVKQDWELLTLDSYLATHKVEKVTHKWTFSEIYSAQINKNIDLKLLSKTKVNTLKAKTLENVSSMIENKYPESTWTLKLIKSSKANSELFAKLKDYYFDKGDNEISKQFFVLENIEKIDIDKVNMAIKAKLNNESIKYTKKDDSDNSNTTNADDNVEDIFNDILNIDTQDLNNETGSIDLKLNIDDNINFNSEEINNTPVEDTDTEVNNTENVNTSDSSNTSDQDIDEIMSIFDGL